MLPGKTIANVCFKTYRYTSMFQTVSFLADFKLGHYMKAPPKSMFLVQFVGTIVATTMNLEVAYWLLGSIANICQDTLLPADNPWTCPNDRVFFDMSITWGLVRPCRIFGALGNYGTLNRFFLASAMGSAMAVNHNSWLLIGIAFNFFDFRYMKRWWERYNLSVMLDDGVAFTGVLLYFMLSMENESIS